MSINDLSFLEREGILSYLGSNSCRSERNKLFYVATPKVACTSLKWWFADLEGYAGALREVSDSAETDPDLVIHDSFHKVAPAVSGLSPAELLAVINSTAYFKFAVVRNPYKRIFSAWQSKLLLQEPLQVAPYLGCDFYNQVIERDQDIAKAFEGFLEHLALSETPNYVDVHWTPQATLLRPDLISYSRIVKIEAANELSVELSDWLGSEFVDPFAVRRTNESLIPYLPRYVTERSSELICKMYSNDFELFGYDTVPPTARDTFTVDQFDLAIRAISMIRARHQRFGELRQQTELVQSQVQEQLRQRDAWEKIANESEQSLQWMSSQRDAWEGAAAENEQSLHWMTSQRDAWEAVAVERGNILDSIRKRLGKRFFSLLSKEKLSGK
jgi:hypothetical protein